MTQDAKTIQADLYTCVNLPQLGWALRLKLFSILMLIPVFMVLPWAPEFGLVSHQEAPFPVRLSLSLGGLIVLLVSLVLRAHQATMYQGAKQRNDFRFRQGLIHLESMYRGLDRLLWLLPVLSVVGVIYLWPISIFDALELLVWSGIVFTVGRPFFRRSLVHVSQWLQAMTEEHPAAWIAPRPERLRIFTLLFLFGHLMMFPLLFRWVVISQTWFLVFLLLGYLFTSLLGQVMQRRYIGRLSVAMRRAHRLHKESRLAT